MSSNKPELNNYSEKYRKELEEKINSLDEHVFRLVNGTTINKPQRDGSFAVSTVYRSAYGLPCRDTIIDPYSGTVVNIAAVDYYDDDNRPIFLNKTVWAAQNGFFRFSKNDANDRKWLLFVYSSNLLADNKHRNIEGDALFALVDEQRDARDRSEKRRIKGDAIMEARQMATKDVIDFAASLGWDETEKEDVLRDRIGELADSSPALFLKLAHDEERQWKSVLKRAITKGVVTYNISEGSIEMDGNAIATLDAPGKGQTYLDMWAKWVSTHPNGSKVFETVSKHTDKAKSVAVAK